MAYQPKSYKKFVATAATATLVASAIAPAVSAASFSDVADRYKEAVNYITEKGYAQGYPNGKFGTDDNIKRQDAAIMIARALGAKADGDYPKAGFTDVREDAQWAVNFLADKKIVSGKAAGKFGANDFMTRGEMAKVIANAYNLKGDPNNAFPFTDVSDTFKEYVDALQEAGVAQGLTATKFGTGDNVTRGQFALFVHRAENPGASEIASVNAVNSKTIEVKFNKAVSKDAALKLTRDGGAVVNVAETNYSEDRKSVKLVLPNKFVAGDYTVALTDGEAKAEKTVTLADEKVTDIKIASDVAIANSNSNPTALTVAYQVLNQYGEDVTADYSVTPTSSQGSATITTNGIIDIAAAGSSTFTFDSNVTVTLLHAQSGTFASKTVKVSAAAKPSAFEMKGLYHADKKTPRAGDSTTGYSVLFKAKDQYGNTLKAANLGTLGTDYVLNSSNTSVAALDTTSITDVKIDGEEYISVPLASGNFGQGTTVFNLISTTSGKSVNSTLAVPAAVAVSNLTLGAPEFAVGGEKFRVPFTALDQDGNAVTNLTTLNAVNFTVSNTSLTDSHVQFVKDYVTGEIYLEVDARTESVQQNKTINIIGTTQNGAVAQRSITLRADAYPASVAGLKNIEKNLVADDQVTLAPSNLVFKDQYGRDMASAPSLGTSAGKYQIKVDTSNSSVVKVSNGTTKTIDGTVTDVTLDAGSTKGSANITVTLLKVDAGGTAQTVSNSSYRFTSNVIEKLDIASLQLDDIEVLNDGSTTAVGDAGFADFDLVVYGVDSNGNKAVIPAADVTVTSSVLDYNSTTGKLSVDATAAVPYASNTLTADVNFIVSAHGKTVTGVVKVTKEAAVLTTVTPDRTAAIATNYKKLSDTSVSVDKTVVTSVGDVLTKVVNALVVEDQYGNEVTPTFVANNIVISNFKDASGKAVATFAAANVPGGSYKVTILLPSGKTVALDVIVAQ